MRRTGKVISKNSNSKFTTRNNKQDIFTGFGKSSKVKELLNKKNTNNNKPDENNPNNNH